MFESREPKTLKRLGKFLPISVGAFLLIVAGVVYLATKDGAVEAELIGVLREGTPDYEWYRPLVELQDPKISMGRNLAGNRILMLSGVVENRGEKTLDVIEMRVEFFNYDVLVGETVRTPIRPGPYSPPIAPLSKRSFDFYLQEFPEDWMAGSAEMSLQGFRFVESN
ncbi:MAG TPA: hypothetical protein VMN76_06645 [Acidobacteriota bacterium]|nr:hypothetical protein [Acidobacteriota bacterium]